MKTKVICKCKCCFGAAKFLGSVDFNKTCEDRKGERIFELSEILVHYYYCNQCGFIFTDYFDNWTISDFKEKLYNKDYDLADPKDNSKGERGNPGFNYGTYFGILISKLIENGRVKKKKSDIKILDYGSGGKLSSFGLGLLESGYYVDSFDPYYLNSSQKLNKNFYDFIFMIEVIEHCHNLEQTLKSLNNFLTNDGFLWIQTSLHEINQNGICKVGIHFFTAPKENIIDFSWYIAPRNGHASIFSFRSIQILFNRFNINVHKLDKKSGVIQNVILAKKKIKGNKTI